MNIIMEYEQMLIGNRSKISSRNFGYDPALNERIALSVFRYAIEKLLRWPPRDAYRFFTPEIVKIMRLSGLLNYIRFPSELNSDNTEYIVNLIYPKQVPYDFSKHVIEKYIKVVNNEERYPKDFMFGNKGLVRSAICLQYALKEELVFHTIEDLYRFFVTPTAVTWLKKNCLTQLYKSFFDLPIEYLHFSLPTRLRNDFIFQYYRFIYKYKAENKEYPLWAPKPRMTSSANKETSFFSDDNLQKKTVRIYQKVLSGEADYPVDFLIGNNAEKICATCLRYAIKTDLQIEDPKKVYSFFMGDAWIEWVKKSRLSWIIPIDEQTPPLKLIHASYKGENNNNILFLISEFVVRYRKIYGSYPSID